MRNITTTVYKFQELTESVQQKILESNYEINVDCSWWEFVYEDAKNIGLEITAFNIDRGSYCEGELKKDPRSVMESILREHGENCKTYGTAKKYLSQLNKLDLDNENCDEQLTSIAEEFTKELLENYLDILRKEYEYLTSEDAIRETIEINEYEFTAEGKRI